MFIISDYVEKINRRNSDMTFAAFFGGLTGALIASSTAKKLPLVTNIPHITQSKKQPEATSIDLETGEFTF
ncbi:MAG: hypothetical protein EOP51_30710 [Sphingobacteriales bacterium]|nr:MAG: hypothetical protein EOP51_30710 [Sphingobacteriales bacterium]